MASIDDEAIRRRAYEIWEMEGRPAGREQIHREQARVELQSGAITPEDRAVTEYAIQHTIDRRAMR